MARLRFDALLDFVEHEGEAAFFAELCRMGMVPRSVDFCEGPMEAEEAVVFAVALRGLGWESQAQEVMELVVGSAMRGASRPMMGGVAAEA